MSIQEIHALQQAGQFGAVGPMLAAYAESYFYRESLVYHNLRRMPDGIDATENSLFAASPTKVATLDDCEPRKLSICCRPAFPMDRPMAEEKLLDILDAIKVHADRLFINLVRCRAEMPDGFDSQHLPQFFADAVVNGQLYFSGIRCAVLPASDAPRQRVLPEDLAQRFKLTEPYYEVGLVAEISVSIEHLVVPDGWKLHEPSHGTPLNKEQQ
jgi:hypothetical protein